MIAICLLAVSTGIPIALTFDTLHNWLWEEGFSKTAIAALSISTLPYVFKFFLGPIVDQVNIPFLHKIGRRKSWSLVSQVGMFLWIIVLAIYPMDASLGDTLFILFFISLCSAFNQAALNAYRVESTPLEQAGISSAMGALGYRLGKLIAGAGALLLSTIVPWSTVYICMGSILLVSIFTVLSVDEPSFIPKNPEIPTSEKMGKWLQKKLVQPFADFIDRFPEWKMIIFFIVIYNIGDFLIYGMTNVFFREIGFTKLEIANITKAFGLICTLLGGFLGGVMAHRMDMKKILIWGVLVHCLSHISLFALAYFGNNIYMLYASVILEHVTEGVKTAALVSFLTSLCSSTYFTASQYAFFSSVKVMSRPILTSISGSFVDFYGWFFFFGVGTILSLFPLLFTHKLTMLKSRDLQ